jgi:hypothetical protein
MGVIHRSRYTRAIACEMGVRVTPERQVGAMGNDDQRWWLRIRRSYGIPDLVTDDHAHEIVAEEIAVKGSEIDVSLRVDRKLGGLVLDAVLDLASEGELDYLVVDKSVSSIVRTDTDDGAVFRRVAEEVFGQIREYGINLDQAGPVIAQTSQQFAERIARSIGEYPFEDIGGHYFAPIPGQVESEPLVG